MSNFTIAIDAPARIAVITWSAPTPTLDATREALASLQTSEGFQPDFGVVSDWRSARAAPDATFVRRFLAELAASRARGAIAGRWATVISPDVGGAVVGMARMTELLSEATSLEYRAFSDLDEAKDWVRRIG